MKELIELLNELKKVDFEYTLDYDEYRNLPIINVLAKDLFLTIFEGEFCVFEEIDAPYIEFELSQLNNVLHFGIS